MGDHTTWLLPHDPPLASDIASIARGTSKWVRTSGTLEAVAYDAVAAVEAAISPVAGVATLILPADLPGSAAPRERTCRRPRPSPRSPSRARSAAEAIDQTARLIREAKSPLFFIGGPVTDKRGARGRDAARGEGRRQGDVRAVPALHAARARAAITGQARLPAVPGARAARRSTTWSSCSVRALPFRFSGIPVNRRASSRRRRGSSIRQRAAATSTPCSPRCVTRSARREGREGRRGTHRPGRPRRARSNHKPSARRSRSYLPENAIVVDEGITSSARAVPCAHRRAPARLHRVQGRLDRLRHAGRDGRGRRSSGASRRRRTSGDGSSLYTLQSLWTQAREGLDVTTIILANDKYAVLQMELMRAGGSIDGPGRRSDGARSAVARLRVPRQAAYGVPARTVTRRRTVSSRR